MELKPVTFQSDSTDMSFSQYYASFMENLRKKSSEPLSAGIEAQLFEVSRRQRNIPFVTVALKEQVRKSLIEGASLTQQHCENILQFIRILENDFSGPPQWLCTSHYDVIFHHSDFKDYSDTPEDGRGVTLSVRFFKQPGSDQGTFQLQAGSSSIDVVGVAEAAAAAAKFLNAEKNPERNE